MKYIYIYIHICYRDFEFKAMSFTYISFYYINPLNNVDRRPMAATTAAHGGLPATGLRPSTRRRPPPPLQVTAKVNLITSSPPIFISTNLAHINPHHLKDLYVLCNHSSHRFPNVDSVGRIEPIDFAKLCTAVSHSSIVVSAFTKPEFFTPGSSSGEVVSKFNGIGGDWIRKVTPVTPENGRLIGFGRAVSDCGLTASIYDVMVRNYSFFNIFSNYFCYDSNLADIIVK